MKFIRNRKISMRATGIISISALFPTKIKINKNDANIPSIHMKRMPKLLCFLRLTRKYKANEQRRKIINIPVATQ